MSVTWMLYPHTSTSLTWIRWVTEVVTNQAKLYARKQRAGDVVGVFDAESIESVHYVGYSMGGWIGTGMALHHPDRLASLTIGGWDPIGGLSTAPAIGTFDDFLQRANELAPALTAWVTTTVLPGLEACWDALKDTDGSEAALSALGVPVLLWSGLADGCMDALQRLQSQYQQFRLLEVPGDHVAVRMIHSRERYRRSAELSPASRKLG